MGWIAGRFADWAVKRYGPELRDYGLRLVAELWIRLRQMKFALRISHSSLNESYPCPKCDTQLQVPDRDDFDLSFAEMTDSFEVECPVCHLSVEPATGGFRSSVVVRVFRFVPARFVKMTSYLKTAVAECSS